MELNELSKALEFCYDNYSHEGELSVLNKTIVIFRKCEYEDENGEFQTPTADCGAFIIDEANNPIYFTGWVEENIGNDLKDVMMNVCENLFSNENIVVKFVGDISSDDYEEEEIENAAFKDLKKIADECGGDPESVTNVNIDTNIDKITAEFTIGWYGVKWYLLGGESITGEDLIYSGEIEAKDETIKSFLNEAFDTKISFY